MAAEASAGWEMAAEASAGWERAAEESADWERAVGSSAPMVRGPVPSPGSETQHSHTPGRIPDQSSLG